MPEAEIDFQRIRTLDGERNYAFEEFCAQLARRDPRVPAESRFVRLEGRGGDGGVECYWQLRDGSEWGYQAKLLHRLDRQQLTDSVETALRIHPKLTRYITCLPFDLSGPTGRHGLDQLTRWDAFAADWETRARAVGMHVVFELWSRSELIDRLLAIDPDGGRRRFWFSIEYFGRDWFKRHVADAIADAGPRYHPELNVAVPLGQALAAFGKNPTWIRSVLRRLNEFEEEVTRWARRAGERASGAATAAMNDSVPYLREAVTRLRSFWCDDTGDLGRLRRAVADAVDLTGKAAGILRTDLEEEYGAGASTSASFRQFHAEYQVSFPAEDFDRAEDLQRRLDQEIELLESGLSAAITSRVLLVTGVAGAGKTHAVCDTAQQRLREGLLSVVVLGDKLDGGPVFDQVRQILGLGADFTRDAMLSALDASAEASGRPLIFFIDALNERDPRDSWKSDLPSFVAQVQRYPNLRLCLSCRTTYLEAVLPDGYELPQIEHNGFVGVELEAIFKFFAYWQLEPPSVPLLQPEYANPLFLRMLCVGLARGDRPGLAERPPSFEEVVDLLLESTERAAEERLDVDRRDRLVHRAVDAIADEVLRTETLHVEWERASQLVNELLPGRPRSRSLLDFLLREGILREVQTRGMRGAADQVRFGFERLGEFLVAERVLTDVQAPEDVSRVISESGLFETVGPAGGSGNAAGLFEALALLLPGRFGLELAELDLEVPDEIVLVVTVRSLSWRGPDAVTTATMGILRRALARRATFEPGLEEAFALAARSGHPVGSGFVDGVLRPLSQVDRDAMLCPFLHRSWERNGVAQRLSTWALQPELGRMGSDTALHWASALSWFCCAADRRVRDHATMAMAALIERNPEITPRLLEITLSVDDDYISERSLLAAYGGLIRADDDQSTSASASVVWERVFADSPPVNSLVRDYARCIIELASKRNVLPAGFELARARPPYGGSLPEGLVQPNGGDEADTRFADRTEHAPGGPGASDAEQVGRAWRSVRMSVNDDDFAIYTMTSALNTSRRPALNLEACKRWILDEIGRLGFDGRFDAYDGYMLQKYGGGRGRPTWAERIGKKYQWIALYRLVGLVDDNIELVPDDWEPAAPIGLPSCLQAPGERNLDPTVLIKRTARVRGAQAWWSPIQLDFRPDLTPEQWLDLLDFPDSGRLIELTDPSGGEWLTLLSYPDWDDRVDRDQWNIEYRHAWMQLRSYVVTAVETDQLWRWLRRQDFHGRWMPEGPQWIPHVFAGEYPWAIQALHALSESGSSFRRAPVDLRPTVYEQLLEFEFDCYHEETISLLVPAPLFFAIDRLRWDGAGGFNGWDGRLRFRAPDFSEPGPATLLAERTGFLSWLQEHALRIVWTTLSEMHWSAPGYLTTHNLGYAVHSRSHRMDDDGLLRAAPAKSSRVRPRRSE